MSWWVRGWTELDGLWHEDTVETESISICSLIRSLLSNNQTFHPITVIYSRIGYRVNWNIKIKYLKTRSHHLNNKKFQTITLFYHSSSRHKYIFFLLLDDDLFPSTWPAQALAPDSAVMRLCWTTIRILVRVRCTLWATINETYDCMSWNKTI